MRTWQLELHLLHTNVPLGFPLLLSWSSETAGSSLSWRLPAPQGEITGCVLELTFRPWGSACGTKKVEDSCLTFWVCGSWNNSGLLLKKTTTLYLEVGESQREGVKVGTLAYASQKVEEEE